MAVRLENGDAVGTRIEVKRLKADLLMNVVNDYPDSRLANVC